jgi:2-polyprenyl-3-methyl-5-hydroxy-6-metoxy-1,4-benzoquinol methylase
MAARSRAILDRFAHIPLEEVPCYLCGSQDADTLVVDPPFKVRRCKHCSLGYTSPRCQAADLAQVYGDGYFENDASAALGYSSYSRDVTAYVRTFRRKVPVISRHATGPRVLDVGCAAGAFLVAMREQGYEPHGLELAPAMVRHAREEFGLSEVYQGTLDSAPFPRAWFDVITLFDVLEHVPDPVGVLQQARTFLRPGGILVLQTQDLSSWLPRLVGSRWHHFKQVEHIFHFNPKTIAEVLKRAGYRIRRRSRETAGKYFSIGDLMDRAHQMLHIPRWMLVPLRPFARRYVWVNPRDEMFIIAEPLREH